jgi:hypothetical protein
MIQERARYIEVKKELRKSKMDPCGSLLKKLENHVSRRTWDEMDTTRSEVEFEKMFNPIWEEFLKEMIPKLEEIGKWWKVSENDNYEEIVLEDYAVEKVEETTGKLRTKINILTGKRVQEVLVENPVESWRSDDEMGRRTAGGPEWTFVKELGSVDLRELKEEVVKTKVYWISRNGTKIKNLPIEFRKKFSLTNKGYLIAENGDLISSKNELIVLLEKFLNK